MGSEIYSMIAGICYWFPKITGLMYNERLSPVHFWWLLIARSVVFIPLFHNIRNLVSDTPIANPDRIV